MFCLKLVEQRYTGSDRFLPVNAEMKGYYRSCQEVKIQLLCSFAIYKQNVYHYAQVILCHVGEVIIFKHGRYISASEYTRVLILSSYVLL